MTSTQMWASWISGELNVKLRAKLHTVGRRLERKEDSTDVVLFDEVIAPHSVQTQAKGGSEAQKLNRKTFTLNKWAGFA